MQKKMWYICDIPSSRSTAIENCQKKTTENDCVFQHSIVRHLLLKRQSGRGPNTVWADSIHNPRKASTDRQVVLDGFTGEHRTEEKQERERVRRTGRPIGSWETDKDKDSKQWRRRGEERRKIETGRSDIDERRKLSKSHRSRGHRQKSLRLHLSAKKKIAQNYLPSSLCLSKTYPVPSTTTHTQIKKCSLHYNANHANVRGATSMMFH